MWKTGGNIISTKVQLFKREKLAQSRQIQNERYVTHGDEVWLWLNENQSQPVLACKIMFKPTWFKTQIQLIHPDNPQPYGVNPKRCYASRREALAARPELASQLELFFR